MAQPSIEKLGDFTGLATNYSAYRPRYSETIRNLILSMTEKPAADLSVADLGAGTGIWTRMVQKGGVRKVMAVEPNDDMRNSGIKDSVGLPIEWIKGSGEETGLPSGEFDLVTAASCFHWFNYEVGMKEIHRLLKPGGRFVALWNPRFIKDNPMLVDFESKLKELAPNIERRSSGSSKFVEDLTQKFAATPGFRDVVYLEGRHSQPFTPDQYIGVWKSVNDIQVQAGPENFAKFLSYVESKLKDKETINCTYLTRAWSVQKI